MSNLEVFKFDGVDVVDSRQVAEMIGKDHAHLMRDIAGYAKSSNHLAKPNLDWPISSSLAPIKTLRTSPVPATC